MQDVISAALFGIDVFAITCFEGFRGRLERNTYLREAHTGSIAVAFGGHQRECRIHTARRP